MPVLGKCMKTPLVSKFLQIDSKFISIEEIYQQIFISKKIHLNVFWVQGKARSIFK